MAGIDHTTIIFRNGMYFKDYDINVNGNIFSYDRDGRIYKVTTPKTVIDKFETHKQYNSDLFKKRHYLKSKTLSKLISSILPKCKVMDCFIEYLYTKDFEMICLITSDYNASFIYSDTDTYVILGGYGHYANPYIHFMRRGYGKEFELKMLKECYDWLCEDVLKTTMRVWAYDPYCFIEEENILKCWEKLKFKPYWKRTKEEKEIKKIEEWG